ncbi:MAG: amino acid adenylation domain-containing protein [Candidatus Aminicenantes bacterium]|jgi:tyrocidine synthetase-3
MDKKNIEDVMALTPIQEGLLYHYLKEPESKSYFEQLILVISGEIDLAIFKQAWSVVVETNEMLRTQFRWEEIKEPVQVVLKHHTPQVDILEYPTERNAGDEEENRSRKEQWFEGIKQADRNKKFNLQQVPFRITLCKLETSSYIMILSNHHILLDGWSNGIILKEFVEAYHQLTEGKDPQPPIKRKHQVYVKWLRDRDRREQKVFWERYLQGFDTRTELPGLLNRPGGRRSMINRTSKYQRFLPGDMKRELEAFARQHKITLATLFYSAWGVVLQRYNNCNDVVYGTTISGRSAKIKGIENMVGLFINTLPLRVLCQPLENTADFLERVHQSLQRRETYETTPLVDIKSCSSLEGSQEMFACIMVIDNYPLDALLSQQNKKITFQSYSMSEMTNYDLTIGIEIFDKIKIVFNCSSPWAEESAVVRLVDHFTRILQEMTGHPELAVSQLEIMSDEEKHQLLNEFNENSQKMSYPLDKTLQQLVEEQAEQTPDHIALVGKEEGGKGRRVEGEKEKTSFGEMHISYRALNDKSHRWAHCLSEKGLQPGMIVGIMVGRSLEMVIGILGILKAGCAYLPIDPHCPPKRIRYMLADSRAKILINTEFFRNSPLERGASSLYLKRTGRGGVCPNLQSVANPSTLAYIIYTSGSTGKPKGVMINHQSAVNILAGLQAEYPLKELDTYLLKTSYVFDVSIAELFGWFWDGGRLVILQRGGEKDPTAILNAIERGRITHINFVPSMFNVFLDELSFKNINKLSSLKYIFLAGEVLLPELVEKFRRLRTGIPLENIYGPTEGTIYSSKYPLSQWQWGSIPIGKPMGNVRLYIFDKDNHLQPIGVPGELGIAGIGLARGYLNQPELTAEKFDHDLWDYHDEKNQKFLQGSRGRFLQKEPPGRRRQKIYRTGDWARWLPDGNIDFLGRIDHQVKVRGFRIELEEIENRLLSYGNIKDAVVIAGKGQARETYLCAYVLLKEEVEEWASRLRTYLSEHLPAYMVPSYFVRLERMPLTPSGKVDLKALPEPQITPAVSYTPPRNARERALVNIWSEVLRINSEKIGIDDGFFQLGGHSLKAMTLVSRIHKEFGVKIPIGETFKTPTIRGLASCIREKERSIYTSIDPREEKEYYPLSSAQKRLFFLDKFEDSGTAYNMSAVFRIEGKTDKARFENTFNELIARHEPLRTSFHLIDDKAVQRIHDEIVIGHWSLVIGEADRKEIDRIIKDFVKPFDLSQAPLLRAGLWKLAEQEHLFLFDIHHIVSDGTSIEILFNDFIRLYEGKKPPQQRIQYKDFILWQHQLLETGQIKEQENYWLQIYPDWAEIPLLNLPTDFPRPPVFCFEGDGYEFKVESETGSRVKDFSSSIGATLYMTLTACLNILLHKYTGQEDIVVGSGIMGRRHGDLHHIIGMFVNSLAVRNYPHNGKTCLEFLKEVKETGIQAFENQDVQFEYLVDQLNPPRNPARNPIFDVLLVVQNFEPSKREIKTPRFIPYPLENKTSKFDLTLFVDEIENEICFNIEYCTALFKKATIQQMADHFLNVLRQVISEPEIKIGDLDILSPGEKQQLLIDFNETTADYPGDKTIHQLFAEQVKTTPDNIAVVGPLQMEYRAYMTYMTYITYRELNNRSNQLAYLLKEKGVGHDTIVGIMGERSIETIVGIMGILKAGGAYLPIDPEYPKNRIKYMLVDSGAKVLVTTTGLSGKLEKLSIVNCQLLMVNEKFSARRRLTNPPQQTNSINNYPLTINNLQLESASLAYIIYTSGTTGKPKGVLIGHRNVVRLLFNDKFQFDFNEKDIWSLFHSFCFDFSVWEMYGALLYGGKLVVIPKMVARDPGMFLKVLQKNRITVLNQTPSAFYQLRNEKLNIRYIIFGGEALKPIKLKQWKEKYPDTKLVNMFGITETTVHVTYKDITAEDIRLNISNIGKSIPTLCSYIVDRNLKLVPIGVTGELCIGGEGLARGYLNRPELTSEKFFDSPYKKGERFYRSGDLARWLTDGNIEFLGRIDYQVKIRGFRIEPGEIENQILNHSHVKEAVVVSREDKKRDKYLCAYIVPTSSAAFENTSGITELRRYLSGKLPDYMVPSYFTRLEQIPLTGSGKVDRKALPEPEVKTGDNYAAPGNAIEKKLVKIWSEVLQVAHLMIGIDDNFFALGGHSLNATILAAKIHKTFNVNLKLIEIFKTPTIKELARLIEAETQEEFTAIKIAEKKDYYELSSAQKRMYILQQMEETSTVYNMPALFELAGEPDKEKLETVFQQLIQRHESLRTSFQMVGEEPMQRIHDPVEFEIVYYDLQVTGAGDRCRGDDQGTRGLVPLPIESAACSSQHAEALIRSFIGPFDLSQAPLLRVGILEPQHTRAALRGHPRRGTDNSQEGKKHKYILMVDMHHIIGDGTSTRILIEEFGSLYAGKELPALSFQYKDYSEWQKGEKAKGALGKQETYWLSQFTAEIPVSNLPRDYPRPIVQQFDGSTLGFGIGPEETQALKTCALKHGTTLYILLLSIYTTFLSKLSGQEHMIVGAPVASRRHANLHQIIGMFVNTLPLTYYPVPAKTFQAFLTEVTDKTLEALENQDYPYEELIERLTGNITRDAGRNPLFDVTFLLQNVGGNIDKVQIPGLVITPMEYPTNTSKFDLSLEAIETGETLSFTFEYSTCLFKPETLQRFSDYFKRLLIEVPKNVSLKLSEMEIISQKERHRLLYEFNDTTADYPKDKVLHQLFKEQAGKMPDNIAIVGPLQMEYRTYMTYMTYITYRELNEKSGQLAHLLIEKGVQTDAIVGIMMDRCLEMIIGILGILKAGGAYMPIDPNYPPERIQYMLKDSGSKFFLTRQEIADLSSPQAFKTSPMGPPSFGIWNLEFGISPPGGQLAYIIYTSGSTGKPKGVLVQHQSVVNILTALQREYPLEEKDTYLFKTSYLFDVSVTELFGWYIGGSRLAVLEKEGERDPGKIIDAIQRDSITHINFVPSMFNVFVDRLSPQNIDKISGLKYIFLAGEVLGPELVRKFRRLNTAVKLENIYGPTEGTIYSSKYSLSHWDGNETVPIGKPLQNTTLYILDKNNRLQPMGIPGELGIGGTGTARGYLNKPELTAEKFILAHSSWLIADRSAKQGEVPASGDSEEFPMSYELPAMSYFYKTGDLVRWLPDGNIEFLTRIDYQVKIRGFRIELGEIETHLLTGTYVKEAVVTTREDETGAKYLCAYIVPGNAGAFDPSPGMAERLKKHLLQVLPGYMIPSFFVSLDKIPLTPNGKVDRRALPEPTREAGGDYRPPRDKLEEILAEIWGQLLNYSQSRPGIDDNFFERGGHSLKAMVLVDRIHKELEVTIPLAEVFKTPTIRGAAGYIRNRKRDRYASIEPTEQKDYHVLSSTQKRLYILHQLESGRTSYNTPVVLQLKEDNIEMERVEETFNKLIARHESLRTSFEIVEEEPVQKIHQPGQVEFGVIYYDLSEKQQTLKIDEKKIIKNFVKPFDLSQAPLMRVGLIKLPHTPTALRGRPSQERKEYKYLLMVDMHHIITDAASQEILTREFFALYRGEELSRLRLRYKDYARWRDSRKHHELMKQQQAYWLQKFSDEIPLLNLPTDYPRPAMQSFAGNWVPFELNEKDTKHLKDISGEAGATPYMSILAVFNILISKLSGQEDIIVGTPTAARRHADLQHIVGMFVNTLAIRNYPSGHKTFIKFLKEVKEQMLNAFENQEYAFEDLVDKISVRRDTSRNPIFDVMFGFWDQSGYMDDFSTIYEKNQYQYDINTSKFDLNLAAVDTGDRFLFKLEYCTRLFKIDTIYRIIEYFKKIIQLLPENKEQGLANFQIITGKEKKQVLIEFNDTRADFPADKTLQRLFEEQVEQSPHRIALIFRDQLLTYRELNKKANQLAGHLRVRGVKPDEVVGLMIERSNEMVMGILAVMKAGGAYLPLDPGYPEERKKYMVIDSAVKILLTNYDKEKDSNDFLGKKEIIDLRDKWVYRGENKNPKHVNKPSDLAYVMYTSGSTGKPKGVILEHRNLVNLLIYGFEFTNMDFSSILQFSTTCFDASFHEIFSALLSGGKLLLIDREIRANIPELFTVIEKISIKTLFLPISFLKVIFNDEYYTKVFPRCVAHIQTAGEQVVISDQFKQHLQGNNIYLHNHYGPTETHVATTLMLDPSGEIPALPSIGKPVSNTCIYILDKYNHLQPVGVTGELYIGGVQVGRGYLNRPDLTAEKFCLRKPGGTLFVKTAPPGPPRKNFLLKWTGNHASAQSCNHPINLIPHSPIYRTGDLAGWLEDGNIEFLGRIDHQVKIRGFRIEPGEIENQLLKYNDIKEAVVLTREDEKGDRYLCAYIMPTLSPSSEGKAFDAVALKNNLLKFLPDYMIPSYFVPVDDIPLTPTGKIDRRALPSPGIRPGEDYIAPRDELENRLAHIWGEVLLLSVPIGIDDHFFHLGGHSLKAVTLLSKIHQDFNVKLPLAEIFKRPTIRSISPYIRDAVEEQYLSIEAVEKKEYHTLSSAQKRLYFLQQMEESEIAYNMPSVWILTGEVANARLVETFKQLIQRHESLRTCFKVVNDDPRQRVYENVDFKIEYFDFKIDQVEVQFKDGDNGGTRGLAPLSKESATGNRQLVTSTIKNFIRPFDLSHAPLLRVGLVKLPHTPSTPRGHPRPGIYNSQEGKENKYLLMVDMHHIVSDGISCDILVKEFMALEGGEKLPALRLQYKDFSQWQNSEIQREGQIKQKAYWKKQLQGEIPVLDLPTDYLRPTIQRFEGSKLTFEIGPEEVQKLQSLALSEGATLYMIVLASYYILLSKLSNQEDILVGTPTAGRRHADLQQIIGMFVNTLVLRNYPQGDKTYRALLNEVKNRWLQAFENQDYPYEELVEEAAITRDASRNPLFDTMFVMQNMGIPSLEIPGLKLTPAEQQIETSKFDLTLIGTEVENKLLFTFEYSTNLFKKTTIERFIDYFKKIVSVAAAHPDLKVCDLEILGEEEKKILLYDFNHTAVKYPKDKTIHQIFAEQVERSADHVALVGQSENANRSAPDTSRWTITYRELNKRANRLAVILRKKGVRADTIVGLMVDRSQQMIICLYGILKAGGAYLPLAPDYPPARIRYMLEESASPLLLTTRKYKDTLTFNGEVFIVDDESLNRRGDSSNPGWHTCPGHLIYTIYTSGSTGRPKGVLVQHGSVVNILLALFQKYPLLKEDTYLLKTTYTFDVSVSELFGWYLGGGRLAIPEPGDEKDPLTILDWIERIGVTHINFVPSMFGVFLEVLDSQDMDKLSNLKYIFLAGEALTPHLVTRFNQFHTDIILENIYGPTENTIYTSQYSLLAWPGVGSIPIGKPLSNIRLYILNPSHQLQPMGVLGELCVGGEGLARGYLNRPELTSEKFDHDLWDLWDYQDKKIKKSDPMHPCNHAAMQLSPHHPLHYPITPSPHHPIYHTGDLARWLEDGNIEFLGRIDHQVKIRGYRVEPAEIESHLLKHKGIKETVVLVKGGETLDKYLCAYVVPIGPEVFTDSASMESVLKKYLSAGLPDYMIPSRLMQLEDIPLSPAGKIDRKALPEPGARKTGKEYTPPGNEIEKKLVDIWEKDLGTAPIGIHDNFFELGGHSLAAIRTLNKIHKTFGVELTIRDLFQYSFIAGLAPLIQTGSVTGCEKIEKQPEQPYYELSYTQKRLWYITRQEPNNSLFNMPLQLTLTEAVDEAVVGKTLQQLVLRHESLRTSFKVIDKNPVQVVEPPGQLKLKIEVLDRSQLQWDEKALEDSRRKLITEESSYIFNLEAAPLFRVRLIKWKAGEYDLVFNMHHLISDGWSLEILTHEFNCFYEANKKGPACEMEPLRLQYKDYAAWQNQLLADEEKMARPKEFWKHQLLGTLPVLNLPYDFSRPAGSKESAAYRCVITEAVTLRLREMAIHCRASLFMVLLAGFNIFLSKITAQEEIIIAIPAAGRQHEELKNIVGLFVNTLIIRTNVNAEENFSDFFKRLRDNTFKILEYQDIPLELICGQLKIKYPTIPVFFNMTNTRTGNLEKLSNLEDFHMEKVQDAKFDMVCYVNEYQNGIEINCHYFKDRFKPLSIEKLMNLYKQILDNISAEPAKKIEEYTLTGKERTLKRKSQTGAGSVKRIIKK